MKAAAIKEGRGFFSRTYMEGSSTMLGEAGFCSIATVSLIAISKEGKVRINEPREGKAGPISIWSKSVRFAVAVQAMTKGIIVTRLGPH